MLLLDSTPQDRSFQDAATEDTSRKPWFLLLALAAALTLTGPALAQISIDTFPDKSVVQRQIVTDPMTGQVASHGDRFFSGTYGGDAETIEARAIDALDGTPIIDWQTLDDSPVGGTWGGVLTAVPAGGWYRLEVRQSPSTAAPTTSDARFGVGVVVLAFGQSNMARIFTEDAQDGSPVAPQAAPHEQTWRLGYGEPSGYDYTRPRQDDIPVTWGPVTGSGGVRLANRLQDALGVPVLILDFALDWTGIDDHWNEVEAPFIGWSRLSDALDEVGNIGAAVWSQGAYEAVNRPWISVAEYRNSLDILYARVQANLSGAAPHQLGVVFLNRGDYSQDSRYDAGFHAVRQAQQDWVASRPEAFAAGNTLDLDISTRPEAGVGHFWATGYELLADRLAQSLIQVLGTPTTAAMGASVSGGQLGQATLIGRHLEVEVMHDQGSRLLLPDGDRDIEGFEVTQGAWGDDDLRIESAALSSSQMGNRVVITLAQVPTAPVRLRYLYGQNPNKAPHNVVARRRHGNWLFDDFSYHPDRVGLPIQATGNDLSVLTISPSNLPPNTSDDHLAIGNGGLLEIDVLANDSDPEGQMDTNSIVLITPPSHGVATLNSLEGTIDYYHDAQGAGGQQSDSFTYAVADSQGLFSAAATVHIDVLGTRFPSIPGRVLHLESDRGLEVDQGGRTIAWRDQSGQGNDLQAMGDVFRLADALNGQDCIELDGQGDKLERLTGLRKLPGGSSDRTVFTVMRYRSNGFGGFAWGSTAEGMGCAQYGNRTFGLIVDSAGDLTVQGWCKDFRSDTPGTGQSWLVQSAKVASNDLFHYWNGKLIDQQKHAFNTNSDGILVLGAELDSSPHLEMDVAAVLVYDRALAESDRMIIDGYLRQKYLGEVPSPPTPENDAFEIIFGATSQLVVLNNDSSTSLPLDPSMIQIVDSPQHGSVTLDPATGVLTYIHDGSIVFEDSFSYTVSDIGGLTSEPAWVQLTITPPEPELVTDGLVLHLESDQGVITAAGNEVLSWLDATVHGNDVEAPTAGPRLTTGGLGTHPYLSFDGDNDQLSRLLQLNGLPVGNADRSIFLLVRYRGEGFGGVSWGQPQCNGVFGLAVDQRGQLAVQGWCFGFDVVSDTQGSGQGWRIHSAIHQQSLLRHYSDSTLLDQTPRVLNTASNGMLALGREIDGSPFIAMDLAAVLIYDRALDPTDRLRLEGYLQQKYLPTAPPGGDQPPEAIDDLVETPVGQTTVLDVLANDLDDTGLDPSTVTLLQVPRHGFATVDAVSGQVIYRADGSTATSDQLTYTVADEAGHVSEPATVFITFGSPLPVTDGLVLRLEPHAGTLLDDGDHHLEAWLDLSGTGNDVWASGRPRIDNIGPGGRPYLRLDGFDDRLENLNPLQALPAANQDRTLFAVVRYHSTGFGGVSYGEASCNQVFGAIVDLQGRLAAQGWCQGNDFASEHSATGEGWLSQSLLLESGTLWHYRDAVLIDSSQHSFDTAADGHLVIGAELDRSPHLEMDVAAVLLFDRALSEDERLAVDAYLGQRYRGEVGAPPPLMTLDDVGHVALGASTSLDLLANDSGDLVPSTLHIVSPPLHGTLSAADPANGTLSYTHLGNPTAYVDRFVYRVEDSTGQVSDDTEVQLVMLPTTDGLVFQLDAAVGPVHNDNTVIGWLDLGGHANDLGALGNPSLSRTRNGAPAITFDGTEDRLQNLHPLSALPANDDERTVFVVANYRGGGFGGFSWGSTSEGNCATQGNRAFGTVVDFRGELAIQGWCAGNDFLSGAPGTGFGWLVQSVVAGGGDVAHFRNGDLIDNRGHRFATHGAGVLMVAAELDGSPSVDMELASVLIFARRLDDSERQQVEAYLKARFIDD